MGGRAGGPERGRDKTTERGREGGGAEAGDKNMHTSDRSAHRSSS